VKKCLFSVFLIIGLGATTFANDHLSKSNDYIAHCNFVFGFSYALGGKIDGSGDLNITLVDRYHDTYHFNYRPGDNDSSPLGFNLMLSFPFYYRNYFSVGMYGQALLSGFEINKDGALYYGGGLYGEGIYKKFSLRAGVGLTGINMDKSVGKVTSAWSGDPGYYTGGKFVEPGTSLNASSYDFLGITGNVGVKYYPLKQVGGILGGIFFQLGYYFFPGITVSDYDLKLSGTEINPQGSLPSFTVAPVHHISLLFGFGL
jgi:hypothetical protein